MKPNKIGNENSVDNKIQFSINISLFLQSNQLLVYFKAYILSESVCLLF